MPQFNNEWLFDSQHFLFVFSLSSPSNANYDGVFGSFSSSTRVPSSSSIKAPFFCSTNASYFASYFKIGNSYSSSFGSLSFFGHFLHVASINEYWFTLLIPNKYST
jgi:hypothetical protein